LWLGWHGSGVKKIRVFGREEMTLIKTNPAMEELLKDFKNRTFVLPGKLQEILNRGFHVVEEGVFFESEFQEDSLPSFHLIKYAYTDLSGYEFAVNKLHLEAYCEAHYFAVALLFIDEFVKKWKSQFSEDVVAVFSYDNNPEFGENCVFQFHKKRKNEVVIDVHDLKDFLNPILAIDTSLT